MSWADSPTRRFYEERKRGKYRGLDEERAAVLLANLDAADSLDDLRSLRSVRLHRLTRDRAGQWSMTVNDRWRICFRFRKGDAYDVQIIDYHTG